MALGLLAEAAKEIKFMEFTMLGLWESMGLAAKAVVLVLAFLSVFSIAIMIERGQHLRRARQQSQEFADFINDSDRELGAVAEQAASPDRGKNCYLAQVVGDALEEVRPLIDQGQDSAAVVAAAEVAVTRAVTETVALLRKRLVHLASTAAGAPFLGLFGTVLGLIRAFQTIATTGSGGLTSVSAGIAEALVTTLVGLFVAIPALWAYNFLADRIDTLIVGLDSTASRTVGRLIRGALAKPSSPGQA
jgi:biopolymer transport protein ExbB/biopolymer transport protein TolQ